MQCWGQLALLFTTACNFLWYCCNLVIVEGNTNAHSFLDCRVVNLAKDYENNLNMTAVAKSKVPTIVTKQVFGKPLRQNWLKLNTDGSFLVDGLAAAC